MSKAFFLNLLLLTPTFAAYTCGFKSSLSTPVNIANLSRETSLKPIRITPILTDISLSANYLDSFIYDIVNGAISYYAKALSVYHISNSLTFQSLGGTFCGNHYINTSEAEIGYQNTDVLIYIGVYETKNQTSAQSFTCGLDSKTSMPVIGFISYYLTDFSSFNYEYLYSTMVHQIAHILVFNPLYYSNFIMQNGTRLKENQVIGQANQGGTQVWQIITQAVTEKAQKNFKCDTMSGLELEPNSLAHWSKRLMMDEFMVIDSNIYDITYSEATLALFQDSGWYAVDYSYASISIWGRSQGCPFITQKCVINQVATNQMYTIDINNPGCDYKRLRHGKTNIKNYTSFIPTAFQYFPDTKLGGDEFTNYCPYVEADADGDCRGLGALATRIQDMYGENIGPNGRCIEGNWTNSGFPFWHASCHQVRCYSSWVDITIGDTVVSCPFTGGFVGVPGYQGMVDCYFSAKLCDLKPCPNGCSGFGECQQGTCYCNNGTVGGDCRKYPIAGKTNDSAIGGSLMVGFVWYLGIIFLVF